jgi:tyrosine-protein kinase Etk/Wzc
MSRNDDWMVDDEDEPRGSSPFHASEFLDLLQSRRKFILRSTVVCTALGLGLGLFMKNNYESTTVIMPPRQDTSAGALLAGAGGASSLLAGGGLSAAAGLNFKNPNEVYVSLLQSRTLTERIVQQFHLQQYYRRGTMSQTIKTLLAHTTTDIGKDGLITLTVTTHDAQLSSQIANAFIDELHTMNTGLAITDASQRRAFYEQQLFDEKDHLATVENALAQTERETGILQPVGQAEMLTRNISTLQAQITQRQATLQSLGTYYTPENPQYKQLQAEIGSLTARLNDLRSSQQAPVAGDVNVPTSQLPKASLEYLRRFRDVQLHEQIYALLEKQFEAAKIDEAKSAPIIQVVDRAVPADRPSGPYRWLIALGGFILGLMLNAVGWGMVYVLKTLRRKQAEKNAPVMATTH